MAKVKKIKPFDSNGGYKWEPEDEFILTGRELAFLFNAMKELIYGSGSIPLNYYNQAYELLLDKVKTGYEQGVVTLHEPETPIEKPE